MKVRHLNHVHIDHVGFVHLCYPPPPSGWVLRLLARLHNSPSALLKERGRRWGETKLVEIGLALTTKIGIVGASVLRVDEVVGRIARELDGRENDVTALINQDGCLTLHQEGLLFEALLDIEAFLSEMHSTLEITGTFIKIFRSRILGDRAGRQESLEDCISKCGIDLCWYRDLKTARNLMTHETAPWPALQVHSTNPCRIELILLKKNVIAPSPEDYVHFDQCKQMYRGYFTAMAGLHSWLLNEIERVERDDRPI